MSLDGVSTVSAGNASAHLAESVYEGVKARMRRMGEEIRHRDAQVEALKQVIMQCMCSADC